MSSRKHLFAFLILVALATLGNFGYADRIDNILPIESMSNVNSCADMPKMYLNQDNDNDGRADYYLYLNSNFILNGTANDYSAGQILRTDTPTKVKYYRPQTDMLYKVDVNNTAMALDNSTFYRASRVFPYNTPLRGIATTPNKVVFERPSDNDPNKNIVSFLYDYKYKYANGFDGTSTSAYRYNQVPDMGYMGNNPTYHDVLPGSQGNRKRGRSSVQSTSSCRNYELHRCGNGVVETYNSSYLNTFTSEQCDGTAGVPAGYTCTSQCQLASQQADLSVTKTVNNPTPAIGSNVIFTMVLSNAGPSTANAVTLKDLLPSGYTYVSSQASQGTYDPVSGIRTVGTIAMNTTKTLTLTAKVKAIGAYINTIEVTASDKPDPDSTPNNHIPSEDDQAYATVTPAQPLSCTLTLSPNPSQSGQIVNVTRNVTGGTFYGTYIYATPNIGGSGRPHYVNPNQYTGTTVALPSQPGTYTFSMTVDNNQSTASCTGILQVAAPAAPTCSLTTSTPTIHPGQTALLNGSYTNATSATLTPLVAGINFTYPTRSNPNISVHPTTTTTYLLTVNGTSGTIPAVCQQTVTVVPQSSSTCTLTTSTPTIISGQAGILSASYTNASLAMMTPNIIGLNFIYPNRSNPNIVVHPTTTTTYTLTTLGIGGGAGALCTTTINVSNPVGLTLNKTLVDNILYQSGDLVAFRIDFGNSGSAIATNVVLSDYLPVSLDYVSSQIYGVTPYSFGTGMQGPNQYVIYSGFNLAPGQQGYMMITGRYKGPLYANQTLNNSFLQADNVPTLYSSALFYTSIPTPNAEAVITKTSDKYTYNLGEAVRFTISVTNNGPGIISNVQIKDTRPNTPCLTIDPNRAATAPMTYINGSYPYTWNINTSMTAGQTISLFLTGHVGTDPSCIGSYTNNVDLLYYTNDQLKTGHAETTINVSSFSSCRSLDPTDGSSVAIYSDGEAEKNLRCTTLPGYTAQTITIDCGNGQMFTGYDTQSFEHLCTYTTKGTYETKCYVDGKIPTPSECQRPIIVDEGGLGYCGDGIREGYEKCDEGEHNGEPGHCTEGCDLPGSSLVACFNIGNTNISVQSGEYLPYRRTLDYKKNIIPGNSCGTHDTGKVPEDSIKCYFKIYNGSHKEEDNDPALSLLPIPCNSDTRGNKQLFKYFLDKQDERRSLQNAFGKYYTFMNDAVIDGTFGEYKIVLSKVTYNYCMDGGTYKGTQVDRVCTVDFTVTRPYLAQKSSFGLTPKATTISLDNYKMINGTELVSSTDLADIMVLNASTYDGGNVIKTMMNSFITKYSKIAIKYKTISSAEGYPITVSKVPSQDIYVFKGNGTLEYTDGTDQMKPFTVIVDGPNLKIHGSIEKTNAMFLVNKGDITFMTGADSCNKTQVVKGIFVTDQGEFKAGPNLKNDSLNKSRCAYGGLKVQGVLIGDNIENLVKSRRSQLNHRFYVGGSSAAAIKTERRNEVFNGASVLIEYSPSLRSALPPGASEFTKALDVYKQ